MGITLEFLDRLRDNGLLEKGNKILDIGSSNLYQVQLEHVRDFISHYLPTKSGSEVEKFASRIVEGSSYDADKGGSNGAFAGELLDCCGINYTSLDIAVGYKTKIFDLNRDRLPKTLRGAFDAVLNIGTTEHVLNQYNSFQVIHDATRVGGCIVHQLPTAGFTDHGYFIYTGRLLFDLVGYNGYEIVDIWYDGPVGEDDLYTSVRAYKTLFPKLVELAAASPVRVPNCALTVIMRKTKDAPFVACLETSTGVGEIPLKVRSNYSYSAGFGAKVRAAASAVAPDALVKWLGRLKGFRKH
ncbi:MAG TPA: hypothetical protein VKY65_07975 [Alphaproteobacteria bacterium]|nr:hypothetical protein [Alphaproteobacteria bacterium]